MWRCLGAELIGDTLLACTWRCCDGVTPQQTPRIQDFSVLSVPLCQCLWRGCVGHCSCHVTGCACLESDMYVVLTAGLLHTHLFYTRKISKQISNCLGHISRSAVLGRRTLADLIMYNSCSEIQFVAPDDRTACLWPYFVHLLIVLHCFYNFMSNCSGCRHVLQSKRLGCGRQDKVISSNVNTRPKNVGHSS